MILLFAGKAQGKMNTDWESLTIFRIAWLRLESAVFQSPERWNFSNLRTAGVAAQHSENLITKQKGGNMNKTDLVNEISKVVCTKKEAEAAVNGVFQAITKAISKGDTVTLIGFGTFK